MEKPLAAALTIPARMLALWVALLCSCLELSSAAVAQSSESVCLANEEEALAQAENFHELAAQTLMRSRDIQWSGVRLDDFDRRARDYVGKRTGESLIFYAWDKTALCAFLWSRGSSQEISRRYARDRERNGSPQGAGGRDQGHDCGRSQDSKPRADPAGCQR